MIDIVSRNNISVTGNGSKPVVFAHRFGCNQNVWKRMQKAFEADYKIILFDFVGSGNSDLHAYDSLKYSSLDGYAQDVIDVIETLQLKDVIFIGHSVASMIGLKAAIKYPGYFNRIIFVAPSPCYFNDGDYVGGLNKPDIYALLDMMDNNYLGWSSALAPQIMANPDRPELSDELEMNFCATDPDIARQFAKVTFLGDNRADLPRLKTRSLTIQCSDDILAPVYVGRYMQTNIPDNSLAILKATGHCPHLSAPEETIAAIKSFIKN